MPDWDDGSSVYMRSGIFPPDLSLIQLITPNKVVERAFREGACLLKTLQTSETDVNCPPALDPEGVTVDTRRF